MKGLFIAILIIILLILYPSIKSTQSQSIQEVNISLGLMHSIQLSECDNSFSIDWAFDESMIAVTCKSDFYIISSPFESSTPIKINGNSQEIRSLDFAPTDYQLVSADYDANVKLWDINNLTFEVILSKQDLRIPSIPNQVKFTEDQSAIFISISEEDKGLYRWDFISHDIERVLITRAGIIDMEPTSIYPAHIAFIDYLQLNLPNDDLWTQYSIDNTNRIYSLEIVDTQNLVIIFDRPTGMIHLWDLITQQTIRTIDTMSSNYVVRSFNMMSVHPMGRFVIFVGEDGNLYIADLEFFEEIMVIDDPSEFFHNIAFSPSGDFVAGLNSDGELKIWSVEISQNE